MFHVCTRVYVCFHNIIYMISRYVRQRTFSMQYILPKPISHSNLATYRLSILEDKNLKLCRKHVNDVAVLCVKFRDDWANEMHVMYQRDFTIFQIKMTFGGIGLILGLRPANERRRYKVTPSLIARRKAPCNAVSHWLGAKLELELAYITPAPQLSSGSRPSPNQQEQGWIGMPAADVGSVPGCISQTPLIWSDNHCSSLISMQTIDSSRTNCKLSGKVCGKSSLILNKIKAFFI